MIMSMTPSVRSLLGSIGLAVFVVILPIFGLLALVSSFDRIQRTVIEEGGNDPSGEPSDKVSDDPSDKPSDKASDDPSDDPSDKPSIRRRVCRFFRWLFKSFVDFIEWLLRRGDGASGCPITIPDECELEECELDERSKKNRFF
jgi:hypothetical protein